MSAVNTAIYSYLQGVTAFTALVSTRLYAEANTASTITFPYVTFSKTSNDHTRHMAAAAGLATSRYEFNVYSTTALQAESIANEIRIAFDGYQHTAMGSGSLDVRSAWLQTEDSEVLRMADGTNVFNVRLDVVLTHAETVPTF